MRIDRAVGRSTALFANLLTRKNRFKMEDFSPHDKPDVPDDISKVFNMVKAAAAHNNA